VADDVWIEWRPDHAPHVLGRYTERVVDDQGLPEPQQVTAECEWPGCGARWKTTCSSGSVRTHIARFGALHLHRDPLRGRK